MKWIQSHLGIRLFLSYLVVVVVGMSILFVTARAIAPGAYQRHLMIMDQQMGEETMMGGAGQGQGRGAGRGQGGNGMMGGFYQDFLASFNEALFVAAGLATVAAVAASIMLSRSITSPIRKMMSASQRIAEGEYGERVEVSGSDEVAQLGARFNEMAAQLEQVELRRRQLIGDVTHELRTPLTAIKGSMEGLMDGVLPAEAETFEQIHREAGRLSRLVDDLQELSRVESRAYTLELRPVDVSASIRTVMKRLAYQFDEKQVKLESDLPAGALMAQADPDRIEQVLTNLLGNALHYTPEGGSVQVRAAYAGDTVQVSVRDTGIGIPPEHLAQIFDRFYRVDKSRSRLKGGSGIGLTIARHLVESHGGRIWAESEGEGQGSAFTFTLPRAH
jgi:histidine kinase